LQTLDVGSLGARENGGSEPAALLDRFLNLGANAFE
jgi:hypothetical protein